MGNFAELLQKIASGEYVHGTYLRKAVDRNGTVCFVALTVTTHSGIIYETTDPADNEHFFRIVDYRTNGLSNYGRKSEDHHYESMGFWQRL